MNQPWVYLIIMHATVCFKIFHVHFERNTCVYTFLAHIHYNVIASYISKTENMGIFSLYFSSFKFFFTKILYLDEKSHIDKHIHI